jgi:prepilin-type N-terminal cleavage/methylation domain-containing protein
MKYGKPSVPSAARRDGGFTLIEALTAIVILSFGLMAVTNLLLVAASSNAVANQSSAATNSAAQVLEQLRTVSFQNLTLSPPNSLTSDQGATVACNTPLAQPLNTWNCDDDLPGVGRIHTRWSIENTNPANPQARFITVRSDGTGPLTGARSRAEFTTIRTCTNLLIGC